MLIIIIIIIIIIISFFFLSRVTVPEVFAKVNSSLVTLWGNGAELEMKEIRVKKGTHVT